MAPPMLEDTSTGDSSLNHKKLLGGKYEVGKLLGCGAFGKVYHARDLSSGHSLAIKVVSKHLVFKGNLTSHVLREISIMRRLHHPHILRLHEVLATKSKILFVLDFAKGGELFAKISKARFSDDLCRKYFQQLISAVGYCHSRGVYHRDLKPENLLLDENWNLMVTDFGLSAVASQIRPDGLLHTLCGTPAYVAPEVLANKGYDGSKVDVWSCGIILYVLNAGYLPFSDPNLMVMYRKIHKGEFRCPKWTSPDLKRFLALILDPNPETRITIDGIYKDPWFQKGGYREIKPHFNHEFDFCKVWQEGGGGEGGGSSSRYLNAFDIICYGLDMSALFKGRGEGEGERFISAETEEGIMDKIEEVGKKEGVRVRRKEGVGARLEGQDGNFSGVVETRRLTEKLVLVEVKKSGGGLWKDKIRPQLNCLVYRPEE